MPKTASPPDLDALFQSGVARHQQGKLDEADAIYRQVLGRNGNHVGAWQLRGVVKFQQKRPVEALPLLERAVALDPTNSASFNNLGNVLIDLGRFEDAVTALETATSLKPDGAELHANLGRALRFYKKLERAADAYRRAIALDPRRAAYHGSLGNVLSALKDDAGALAAFEEALRLAPDQPNLIHNMALSLLKLKRPADAEVQSRRAIALKPEEGEYYVTLGAALRELGRIDDSIEALRTGRDLGTIGKRYQKALVFHLSNAEEMNPLAVKKDTMSLLARLGGNVSPYSSWGVSAEPDRPLKIGLVSGDFRDHPVGRFLLGPLSEVDQDRFEIHAYSQVRAVEEDVQIRLRRIIRHWNNIDGEPDDVVASKIRADKIDILVDLSGHTANNRLTMFAYKPAPIACTWLGYFATTGVTAIDYVLCNQWLLPEGELNHFVEKPWYLPDTHWCFSRPAKDVDVGPLPSATSGIVTFGSYNNFHKLSPAVIRLWARLIREMPNSRLHLRFSAEPPVVERLRAALLEAGAPEDRIEVLGNNLPYEEHLASYGNLDIALDPFPYNGGTTTAEALYMGVPVLTLRGDRFSAHMAESTVRSAGLDDWVALTPDEYVAKAAAFAADTAGLAALRAELRERVLASKLFDARRFAADLEDAFRGMWRKWCAEQAAAARTG